MPPRGGGADYTHLRRRDKPAIGRFLRSAVDFLDFSAHFEASMSVTLPRRGQRATEYRRAREPCNGGIALEEGLRNNR